MFELAEPDALSSVNKAATREVLDGSAQAAVKKRTGVCQICRHATGVGMGTNWEQTGDKLLTNILEFCPPCVLGHHQKWASGQSSKKMRKSKIFGLSVREGVEKAPLSAR